MSTQKVPVSRQNNVKGTAVRGLGGTAVAVAAVTAGDLTGLNDVLAWGIGAIVSNNEWNVPVQAIVLVAGLLSTGAQALWRRYITPPQAN